MSRAPSNWMSPDPMTRSSWQGPPPRKKKKNKKKTYIYIYICVASSFSSLVFLSTRVRAVPLNQPQKEAEPQKDAPPGLVRRELQVRCSSSRADHKDPNIPCLKHGLLPQNNGANLFVGVVCTKGPTPELLSIDHSTYPITPFTSPSGAPVALTSGTECVTPYMDKIRFAPVGKWFIPVFTV